MSEEELLEEIKRHIDYTNAMGEKSLRDLQIENLYNLLQQKETIIKEVRNWVNSTIDVIKQQPTGNDEWILERLNGFLEILDKDITKKSDYNYEKVEKENKE